MKRILIVTVLGLIMALSAFAQTRSVTVSGRIIESDSKQPAIQATIQLLALPDSAQVTGQATSVDGKFKLTAKSGKYVIKVSYLGFKTIFLPIQVTGSAKNLGDITMEPDAIMLAEAVVTGEAPQVQVVEDTLQYNASAYRTPEGAMLEELVKKIPGAEIDDDGNVKINGKDVSKLLVNGKEFFGGDVATGLKNLPVEMIEKLKAYDKKSDLARITGIDDGEEETVIDVGVKKEMNKGLFGNADLAGGTEDRYSGRGMVNYFNDATRVSLMGSLNNVNDQGFSGGGGGPRWRRNNGLTARKWIGIDFTTQNEKIELGGSARYNYTGSDVISTGYNENFLTSGNSYSNSNSLGNNRSRNFSADFRLEWKPDTLTNIIFRPDFSYGKTDNLSNSESGTFNADPYSLVANPNDYLDMDELDPDNDPLRTARVNAINSGSMTDGKNSSLNATLQVNRRLSNDGRNITFRGRFSYGDNVNRQYTENDTYYYLLQSMMGGDSILIRNQYIHTPTKDFNYRAQLTYSEPIAKATFLQFSYQFQYRYSESDKRTYDLAYDREWGLQMPLPGDYGQHEVDSLGKYAEYRYYNHDASVSLRFIREKYQLSAGISLQPQHTILSYKRGDYMIDTTRNVFNFAPNIDFRYRFSKVSQLRFTYRGRSSQPSMENLLPIVDNSNPQNIRMGNPGLKPSFSHNVRLMYNTYDAEKQRGIFTHFSYQMTQNSISNSRTYNDQTGGWTTMPKNINGNWNTFGMFGINTALKDKRFTIGSFTNYNYMNNVGYLTSGRGAEAVEQKNTTTNLGLNERLTAAFRNDWIEVGVNGTFSYTIEKDKLTPANNQEPYNYSYGGFTTITAPWGTSLSTNIANQSRRGYRDSSMNRNELIWNAQIAHTFLKGAATISFEMYDILKQQSNISRSLTSDGRSVYEYNGINSYCMLHFSYRFNLFGGKGAGQGMRGPGGFGGPRGSHGPRRF